MRYIKLALGFLFLLLFLSCYSIRLKVSNGQGEPADTERDDALSGLLVRGLERL